MNFIQVGFDFLRRFAFQANTTNYENSPEEYWKMIVLRNNLVAKLTIEYNVYAILTILSFK